MDPTLNAVNVCSTKSTNKLRHFRIFVLFILFEEHSHHLNQAITKSNCGNSEPSWRGLAPSLLHIKDTLILIVQQTLYFFYKSFSVVPRQLNLTLACCSSFYPDWTWQVPILIIWNLVLIGCEKYYHIFLQRLSRNPNIGFDCKMYSSSSS